MKKSNLKIAKENVEGKILTPSELQTLEAEQKQLKKLKREIYLLLLITCFTFCVEKFTSNKDYDLLCAIVYSLMIIYILFTIPKKSMIK